MTEQLSNRGTEPEPYGGVPEGDLPAGFRPKPGPRAERRPWTGREHNGQPVLLDPERDGSQEFGAARQLAGKRVIGIDVARGVALLGMVGVHTLPAINADTEGPTLFSWVAAGNAAALFAMLAGIGLALISGGARHVPGLAIRQHRWKLLVRAVLIFLIGVAANQYLDPPVYNILPYYGLLFLLAIPFLGLRKRVLAAWAAALVVVSPFLLFLTSHTEPFLTNPGPYLQDLVIDPVGVLGSLLLTGSYPVATWFVYVLVGMVVGRLALDRIAVQINLLGYGMLLALLGQGLSYLSVWYLGGWERMLYSEVSVTVADVTTMIKLGTADEDLPTSSLAWLTVASPHSNTTFALLHTTGIALAVLGATLLLCRAIPGVLAPLAKVGGMTLTLYVGHLAFLTLGFYATGAWFWFTVQLVAGVAFAYGWTLLFRQGPLEMVVAKASGFVAAIVPVPEPSVPPRRRRYHDREQAPREILAAGRHRHFRRR